MKLGYQSPVCSSRKRKLPTERMPPVPLKRLRKSETHETVTDTDFANPSRSRVGGHELPNTPNNHKKSVDDTSFDSESMGDFWPNTNDNKQSTKTGLPGSNHHSDTKLRSSKLYLVSLNFFDKTCRDLYFRAVCEHLTSPPCRNFLPVSRALSNWEMGYWGIKPSRVSVSSR